MFDFDRFSDRARRVMFWARYEAGYYGSPEIESVHLLLGLLREEPALVNSFLPQPGSADSLRRAIEARISIMPRISTSFDIPLSDDSRSILNYAVEEADQRSRSSVDSEHLMLGLLRHENCLASRVFREQKPAHLPTSKRGGTLGSQDINVQQVVFDILTAWDERDSTKFSHFFGEEGCFMDVRGELWIGPSAIEKALASYPSATERGPSAWRIEEARFPQSDLAVATALQGAQEESLGSLAAQVRITLVMQHRNDRWYVAKAHMQAVGPASEGGRVAGGP